MKFENSIKWLSIIWGILLVISLVFLIVYFSYETHNDIHADPFKLISNLENFNNRMKEISLYSENPVRWIDVPFLKIATILASIFIAFTSITILVWISIILLNSFNYDKYTYKLKWWLIIFLPVIGIIIKRNEL